MRMIVIAKIKWNYLSDFIHSIDMINPFLDIIVSWVDCVDANVAPQLSPQFRPRPFTNSDRHRTCVRQTFVQTMPAPAQIRFGKSIFPIDSGTGRHLTLGRHVPASSWWPDHLTNHVIHLSLPAKQVRHLYASGETSAGVVRRLDFTVYRYPRWPEHENSRLPSRYIDVLPLCRLFWAAGTRFSLTTLPSNRISLWV
jgi:hypothetical protein